MTLRRSTHSTTLALATALSALSACSALVSGLDEVPGVDGTKDFTLLGVAAQ